MVGVRFFTYTAFLLTAISAIVVGFFSYDKAGALHWIASYEYWTHTIALGLSVFAAVCFFRSSSSSEEICAQSVQHWILPVLFILLVSFLLLQSQPREFKVVMDEPVLMATALQMHELRESKTTAKAYEINGDFEILSAYTDKRPTLFPFIISQLHSLTGYRGTQGLWFNAFLTPVFLALLFIAGNLFGKRWGGYLALVLFSTVPLLAMNMCGSGFELLNLTLLLATGLVGYWHLQSPSTASSNFFVMLGVLLAHTRYESALYVVAIGGVLVLDWWRRRQVNITWGLVVAPLLLISLPLRRIIHSDNDSLWQLEEKGASAPFSIDFLGDNLAHAFHYFFAYDLEQANSLILSVSFILSMLLFLWLLQSRRLRVDIKSPLTLASFTFGAVVLFNFGLLMCYFWGQIDDIIVTRIILPFLLFQVLFVVGILARIRWIWCHAVILIAAVVLYFFSFSRPLMAQSNFLMSAIKQQEFQWTYDYIASCPDEPILFISAQHFAALVQRRSGLIPDTAIERKLSLDQMLQLRTFSQILIVEFVPFESTVELEKEKSLAVEFEKNFETETLIQEKINNYGEMRVLRIMSVRMDEQLRERMIDETQDLFKNEDAVEDFYRALP
jgi:hypothetical protein